MTTDPAESPLLQRISQFLTTRGLAFVRHETLPLVMLRFVTDEAQWGTFVDVQEQPPRFAIYSIYSEKVAVTSRSEMAELVTRLNYGAYVGNFELDLDDGTVRYKTSVELADVELTAALFDRLLMVNLEATKRHARVIAEVASGALSARQASLELGRSKPASR